MLQRNRERYFFPFSTVKMIHVCVANERGIISKAAYPLFSAAFKINNQTKIKRRKGSFTTPIIIPSN
jgi:hypothetical protein